MIWRHSLFCKKTDYPYVLLNFNNNIISVFQNLDSEIVVAAARAGNSAAISANLVFDERQMNALFLDVVCSC